MRIRVPGSTSNLGSGFDTVSAALSVYLTLEAEVREGSGIEWPADWELPESENMILQAFEKACDVLSFRPPGLRIETRNEIPLKRGLGSSAAAIVAGIKLAEALAGKELGLEALFAIAYPLENHPDNLAASALGGWAISRVEGDAMRAERLASRLDASFVAAIPERAVSTREARRILPEAYSLSEAVFNLQRVALLVHALSAGRADLMKEACEDRIHQPYRARLVPGLESLLLREDLPGELQESLLAITISGSGSTVLALVKDKAQATGEWMVTGLRKAGSQASFRILKLDTAGPVAEPETGSTGTAWVKP